MKTIRRGTMVAAAALHGTDFAVTALDRGRVTG